MRGFVAKDLNTAQRIGQAVKWAETQMRTGGPGRILPAPSRPDVSVRVTSTTKVDTDYYPGVFVYEYTDVDDEDDRWQDGEECLVRGLNDEDLTENFKYSGYVTGLYEETGEHEGKAIVRVTLTGVTNAITGALSKIIKLTGFTSGTTHGDYTGEIYDHAGAITVIGLNPTGEIVRVVDLNKDSVNGSPIGTFVIGLFSHYDLTPTPVYYFDRYYYPHSSYEDYSDGIGITVAAGTWVTCPMTSTAHGHVLYTTRNGIYLIQGCVSGSCQAVNSGSPTENAVIAQLLAGGGVSLYAATEQIVCHTHAAVTGTFNGRGTTTFNCYAEVTDYTTAYVDLQVKRYTAQTASVFPPLVGGGTKFKITWLGSGRVP